MISAIGKPIPMRRGGFSLIEILLVLALMAIGGTVVILNYTAYADRREQNHVVEQLTQTVRKARFLAAQDRRETRMRFDPEGGRLLVEHKNFTLHSETLAPEFRGNGGATIRFLRVPSAEGLSPPPPASAAREPLAAVRFASDGSCTPFVVEVDPAIGATQRLAFDPFSNLRKDLE